MEKIKNFFKKYVFPASFIFTVFTFVMLAVSSGANSQNGDVNSTTLKISLIAFVYFVYVMLCAKIYKTSIQPFFRALIHYLLTGLPLVLLLVYISGKQASNESALSPSTIVILMVIFTLIYAVIAAIAALVSKKKSAEDGKDYKKQFGKM